MIIRNVVQSKQHHAILPPTELLLLRRVRHKPRHDDQQAVNRRILPGPDVRHDPDHLERGARGGGGEAGRPREREHGRRQDQVRDGDEPRAGVVRGPADLVRVKDRRVTAVGEAAESAEVGYADEAVERRRR